MLTPTLLRDRPRSLQIVLGGVVPFAIGAVAGILLGVSAGAYYAVGVVAAIGGVLAGFEHRDGWGGADRGLAGGALFGTFLLIAHAVAGGDAKVALPEIQPVLVVFTAIVGMFAGALGGRLRRVLVKPDSQTKDAPTSGSAA
jgi:hypothetical protein